MNYENDIFYQSHAINCDLRSEMKDQIPAVVWFTGLSGSGKSTLANLLEISLAKEGKHTYLLDGDNIRLGLCKDLGFSDEDREENIRRISEVSKLFVDAGILVITAFISPFSKDREMARSIVGKDRFIEVFVNTPLAECERRDPKGLYSKARSGLIKNFTGIDSAYENPVRSEIEIHTMDASPTDAIQQIIAYLRDHGFI